MLHLTAMQSSGHRRSLPALPGDLSESNTLGVALL